ncbi:MAG: hypothetical protein KDK66_07730, partial [Deltaproteobacteria bacterium]|nr:hypothetical protein [Deltaproteobacteria bacterium]
QKMFYDGALLTQSLHGRLKLEIKCVVLGGLNILKKIKALQYDTLHQRPILSAWDKLSILTRALFLFGSLKRKNNS